MARHHMRLVHSAGRSVMRERVFPQTARCFRCREVFDGQMIGENDGACDDCCIVMDAYTNRSEQNHGQGEEDDHRDRASSGAGAAVGTDADGGDVQVSEGSGEPE